MTPQEMDYVIEREDEVSLPEFDMAAYAAMPELDELLGNGELEPPPLPSEEELAAILAALNASRALLQEEIAASVAAAA